MTKLAVSFPDAGASTGAWAERIAACWQMSVQAILEVGRLLTAAKAALPHGAFGAMVENELPFSASTAQRLMAIADDPKLSNPAHVQHLPPSWGTLYELTKLDAAEFEAAIEKKIIRPDMDRKDVADHIRPQPVPASPGPAASMPLALVQQPEPPQATLPNGARAIMNSRQEPDDSLDYFPTPPWATRALIERVLPALFGFPYFCGAETAWEPACGEGHMAEVLREYFPTVEATDIFNYGYGKGAIDFLGDWKADVDWIITNPPFNEKSEAFVLRALDLATKGVAMFVRLQWLETIGRYERIFSIHPPTLIAFFAERVNLCKGRWEPEGGTATAYLWLVWVKDQPPQPPFWIPPGCRKALSKPDDASRFTANPVIKREHFNSETGEIIEPAATSTLAASEPACADPQAPQSPAHAGSLNADQADIPAFLRRQEAIAEAAE